MSRRKAGNRMSKKRKPLQNQAMELLWACPNPECPPTEFEPVDVTAPDDDVATAVCGGKCGQTYPLSAFKRVAP
jgi:hypothetical protein